MLTASIFEPMMQQMIKFFSDPTRWTIILIVTFKVIFIFIAGRIVINVSNKAINHMMVERERNTIILDSRRSKTLGRLIRNIISYTVNFIVILLILNQFGFQLAPLLAGAGVIGLAIGFGAQSLVKDVITGFFIIFEDQFAVGDVIQTGTFKGTVEEIGLRVTRIKSWNGEMYFIPNGSIQHVTNFSLHNSVGVVDISIAYEADIDQAVKVIKDTVQTVYESNENMIQPPTVLGVQTLGSSEVVLRITFECKPNQHFAAARQLNEQIKKKLDAFGIEIPYPRLVTFQRTES